jgi:hypothetical protein
VIQDIASPASRGDSKVAPSAPSSAGTVTPHALVPPTPEPSSAADGERALSPTPLDSRILTSTLGASSHRNEVGAAGVSGEDSDEPADSLVERGIAAGQQVKRLGQEVGSSSRRAGTSVGRFFSRAGKSITSGF